MHRWVSLGVSLFLLSISTATWAMEHYTDSLQSETGQAIGNASVSVYLSGTLTLATIYSDNGVTSKANPFTTNTTDGTFSFYAANGVYDIVFRHAEYAFDDLHTKRVSLFDVNDFSGGGGGGGGVSIVTEFPGGPTVGMTVVVTDDSAVGACDSDGGSEVSLCTWDGLNWVAPVNLAEQDTLDSVFDRGKIINGANSLANCVEIGDGTTPMCGYTDSTLGPLWRPKTLSNTRTYIWSGFNWCLYGIAPDSCLFTVDPGAATALLKYTYQPGHRPLSSVYLGAESLHGDGTNCPADPTKVTISNQPRYTFICTENNGSRLKGVIPMRNNWDAGTIFIKPHYSQTAADTGSVALEVAAACRAFGVAFNGTYGTEVEVDDAALVGSGAIESTLSAAVTPNGTCAAGDLLYFYIDVDATDNPTTAAATLNFLGADVFWSITSPSH